MQPTHGKNIKRLLKRLNKECGLGVDEDSGVVRTNAGHWQKSQGAFSWYLYNVGSPFHANLGSRFPISDLLRCPVLEVEGNGTEAEVLPCGTVNGQPLFEIGRDLAREKIERNDGIVPEPNAPLGRSDNYILTTNEWNTAEYRAAKKMRSEDRKRVERGYNYQMREGTK